MILTYDSILGIPIIEGGGENTNTNNSGINIGVPSIILLIVVIGLFVILFSTLGKNSSLLKN